ncbi:hypothetical protein AOQ72_16820 [Bradyrhizobium yuanmingense]|uniref:Uncharacterized protein n=1 Tax=Bradyrhizobium yuanmingense TaxID=108015 RepID=A0A0R3CUP0_9BRAD|nr:hypothetical protein AOQ72_16820 [Bradyrhizobium yuanmingense]
MLEHLGDAELVVLRMAQLAPQLLTALGQPRVQLRDAVPAPFGRLDLDPAAAVLHVLLDDSLLPARSDVAEVGIE